LIGLFVVVLLFHLLVVWQDFAVLAKNGYLYDDSFYAFKIAHNIALGQGPTFDGAHPTNGFQPLYVFMLVPLYWLGGSNLYVPVYAALILSALFTALTCVLLFKITERYVSFGVALLIAVLWGFSPVVTRQTANGLETSLALLISTWAIYAYLTRVRPIINPPGRSFALLGAVLGLAMLARVDQCFLALAMLLDYLFVLRKRGEARTLLRKVVGAIGVMVLVYLPWAAYSFIEIGRVFQESGTATRFLSIAYAPFFHLGPPQMLQDGPTGGFIWRHVTHAFAVLKVTPPFHTAFRMVDRAGDWVGVPSAAAILGNVFGLVLLAALIVFIMRRRPADRGVREVRFLFVFAAALVASYSFYVFGVFFFIRYLYPLYLVGCIYAAFALQALLVRLSRTAPRARTVVASGLVVYLSAFTYMAFNCAFNSQPEYCFYDVAKWVEEHVAPNETVGVFQGGAVGYLSDRRVVNLDGKVNGGALEALKNGTLVEYLDTEGIDVVLDNRQVISLFLGKPDQDTSRLVAFDRIMFRSDGGVPGWTAYRLRPAIGSGGGGPSYANPGAPSGGE